MWWWFQKHASCLELLSSGITEASALEFLSSKVERIVNPDSGHCGAMS